ncbi:Nucleotidyltransferase [Poronia punctata]|nr:Nucleotidyltransferase [Poronia punctata]
MAEDLVFPTIFLLPTHFDSDELAKIESRIPTLTYDITEAEVVLGKVARKPRALLELRSRKLITEEIQVTPVDSDQVQGPSHSQPPAKRRKLSPITSTQPAASDESTASDTDQEQDHGRENEGEKAGIDLTVGKSPLKTEVSEDNIKATDTAKPPEVNSSIVRVVRLSWFTDSLSCGKVLPFDDYLVYQGRKTGDNLAPPPTPHVLNAEDILRRVREEEAGSRPASQGHWPDRESATQHPRSIQPKRPHLLQETTSEHEISKRLPPVPDYLHTDFSCQRPTPLSCPNDAFVEQLKKMRTIRTLEDDKVGVRAYSTSIAAVAAYPHPLSSPLEVARLPGCGPKIVELFRQWRDLGYLEDVQEAASNPRMKVLLLFYDIWGVAAKTAIDFYNRGWRDLDDIVEFGWDKINRVQQIGVKYYEEFQEKIPRAEVEAISAIILEHAQRIREGFQMVIVGGYRRGKAACGDVDVILSHPDQTATEFFINEIVSSLETSGHITHTLTISDKNSERGQEPVAWKGEDRKAGTGFDTLDKALVVWQDPVWDKTKAAAGKNPNIHRRVDIISKYSPQPMAFIYPSRSFPCARA